MAHLDGKKGVAVFASLGVLTYLLFGAPLADLFSSGQSSTPTEGNMQISSQQGSSSSLRVEDSVVGTGEVAEAGDSVSVHYTGTLTDGTVFDSSVARGVPFSFTLGAGEVIKGWDQGVAGMRVGGKRVLTIAPELAYGASAVGPIPPNSTLVFEVELLSVDKN